VTNRMPAAGSRNCVVGVVVCCSHAMSSWWEKDTRHDVRKKLTFQSIMLLGTTDRLFTEKKIFCKKEDKFVKKKFTKKKTTS